MCDPHNKHLSTLSNVVGSNHQACFHLCLPGYTRPQVQILAEQLKRLFKHDAKLHFLLPTCVCQPASAHVGVCLCACWCNNLCSLPHYTVLHLRKWVLSMFLHLNYATDVLGSGVAEEEEEEEEEECRGSSYTPPRDQRASATLGDLFSLSRMPPSLFTNQRCFQNQCVRVC